MKITSFKIFSLVFGGVLSGLITNASAQMLQQPLQVGGEGVPPNLVFTLDDSGSMWWECLPDSLCTQGSNGLEAIPKRDAVNNSLRLGTIVYDDVNVMQGNSIRWSANNNVLLSRQMRSSAFNPLYYNPNILYRPWLKADGSRYPSAPPNAAPVIAGASQTQNLMGQQNVSSTWCRAASSNTCMAGTTQNAVISRYYNMTGDGNASSNFALVLIQAGGTYPKAVDRTDCAGASCTYNEEIQNFANWYTYYRTRALTAIAGTAEAFADVPANYRVGYGRINKTGLSNIDGSSTKTLERGVRAFAGVDKANFYQWLTGRTNPSGGTPLRRAMDDVGQYFSRADNKGPWGADPGKEDSSPHASCRRSIHLLMTDGMWNGDGASTLGANGNADGSSGSTITSAGGVNYKYTPSAPYSDNFSGTLADVAMYYWKNDLRPDLPNTIKPIATAGRENPAFWQHMVNFTIAFGVNGNLRNPQDLVALTSGGLNWGNPNNGGPATVDDLWHAALNSRGRALSARNAVDYSAAIRSIIDEMASMQGSEAGLGVSNHTLPSVGSSTKTYTASFATPAWNGDVKAHNIDNKGVVTGLAWSAAEALPTPASRRIFTYKPSPTTKGIGFAWANLSTEMQTALWGSVGASASDGNALVNYLRGDATNENATNGYRVRTRAAGKASPLGDIVNSSPLLVSDQMNSFYEALPPKTATADFGAESYSRFLRAKGSKFRSAHLIAGSNDGMLHAFNDSDGEEAFAFVPSSLMDSLKQLWNQDYSHRYFVDGPAVEADIYDPLTKRWKNLVQGSGGAGGKYLYSINMPFADWPAGQTTEPTAQTRAQSAPGANDILWEVNPKTAGFEELGYVLGKPESGLTRDGSWVTIVGNGYESTSGKAQLFVINALTGALIKRIDTGAAGTATNKNGLSGVGVVRDMQQRIVAVYGGDLLGNMWKFDLSATSSTGWKVAFDGKPLVVVRGADNLAGEPITAKPTFRAFPTGGVMVLFGTGKIFAQGDDKADAQRALYGVWDKVVIGTGPGAASDALSNYSGLVEQKIVTTPIPGGVDGVYRSFNLTPVDYGTKRGWRMPLTIAKGERMVDEAQMRYDSILMQTITPSAVADECQAAQMVRRAYMLDPFMSGSLPPPFDADANGTPDSYIVDLDGTGPSTTVMQQPKCTGAQCDSNGGTVEPPCTGPTCNRMKCPKSGLILGANAAAGLSVCFGDDSIRRQWRQLVSPPQP